MSVCINPENAMEGHTFSTETLYPLFLLLTSFIDFGGQDLS